MRNAWHGNMEHGERCGAWRALRAMRGNAQRCGHGGAMRSNAGHGGSMWDIAGIHQGCPDDQCMSLMRHAWHCNAGHGAAMQALRGMAGAAGTHQGYPDDYGMVDLATTGMQNRHGRARQSSGHSEIRERALDGQHNGEGRAFAWLARHRDSTAHQPAELVTNRQA